MAAHRHLRGTVIPILQDSEVKHPAQGQPLPWNLNPHSFTAKALTRREVQDPQFKLLVYWGEKRHTYKSVEHLLWKEC